MSGNTKNSFASLIGVSPATLTILFKDKKLVLKLQNSLQIVWE